MKKLITLVSIILILFISFIIWYNTAKEYEITYSVNDYEITERYFKKEKLYKFTAKKEEQIFEWIETHKYQKQRKLIEEITEIKKDEEICISSKGKELDHSSVCKKKAEYIDYHLVDQSIQDALYTYKVLDENKSENYQNIQINNLDDYDYLVWNYKGFYHINEKSKEEITLFPEKDVYNIPITGIVGNYMIIADYEEEHNFHKFYVINLKDNSISEWKLKQEISFDSYILGSKDKSIYLVDRKNKIEYELVPHKKKMRKVGTSDKQGRIYEDGWKKISLTKLVNEEYHFQEDSVYQYEIMNNHLYRKDIASNMLVSSSNVKYIVSQQKDSVFYFADNVLYRYDPIYGERKVMENFEWNFNYKNMVFIY